MKRTTVMLLTAFSFGLHSQTRTLTLEQISWLGGCWDGSKGNSEMLASGQKEASFKLVTSEQSSKIRGMISRKGLSINSCRMGRSMRGSKGRSTGGKGELIFR